MKKAISLLLLISIANTLYAQLPARRFGIGVNPLALAEPSVAISTAGYYQFTKKFGIMAEPALLLGNSYFLPNNWKNIKGFRIAVQPKLSISFDNGFYLGFDGRFKSYSFNSTGRFIKNNYADTILVNGFRQREDIFGGALQLGLYVNLNKKETIFLDFSLGIGAKHRYITRKSNIAGYDIYLLDRQSDVALHPPYEFNDAGTVYTPGGVRLVFLLNKH